MKCQQCGNECNDSAVFCNACGAKLIKESISEPVQPSENLNTQDGYISEDVVPVPDNTYSTVEPVTGGTVVPPNYSQPVVKKKSKLPLLLVAVVLLIVLAAGAIVFGKNFIKSDVDRLMDAMMKNEEAEQFELVGEIGFNEFDFQSDDPVEKALIENILKGAKLDLGAKADKGTKEVEGNLGFSLSGSQILNVSFHMNEEFVALDIPKLYSKAVYINWKDFKDILIKYDIASEDDMSDFDINRIIELMDAYKKAMDVKSFDSYKKFDQKKYEEAYSGYKNGLVKDVSGGKMDLEIGGETYSYSGKIYVMDMEMDKYIDMMVKVIEIAIGDDTILPIITEGADRVIDTTIKEEDIYVYNLLASENGDDTVSEWDKDLEDKLISMKEDFIENLTDEYDQGMNDIEDAMSEDSFVDTVEAIKEVYSEIDYTAKYIVDKGYVQGMETTITVDDSIIDALRDLEKITGDPTGMTAGSIDDIDAFFKLSVYARMAYVSIDKKIEFTQLPSNAIDFATATDEELMEIYQEIMTNAQTLTQSFSGM